MRGQRRAPSSNIEIGRAIGCRVGSSRPGSAGPAPARGRGQYHRTGGEQQIRRAARISSTPILAHCSAHGSTRASAPCTCCTMSTSTVYPGQVTALVGDNGAGKSTLVKCVTGIYATDSGDVGSRAEPVTIAGPKDADALGIKVVYQDLALCDNLDIVQNMFLGREIHAASALDEPTMENWPRRRRCVALRAHRESRCASSCVAVRRSAPDRRHRQGRALELAGRASSTSRPPRSASPRPNRCWTS